MDVGKVGRGRRGCGNGGREDPEHAGHDGGLTKREWSTLGATGRVGQGITEWPT